VFHWGPETSGFRWVVKQAFSVRGRTYFQRTLVGSRRDGLHASEGPSGTSAGRVGRPELSLPVMPPATTVPSDFRARLCYSPAGRWPARRTIRQATLRLAIVTSPPSDDRCPSPPFSANGLVGTSPRQRSRTPRFRPAARRSPLAVISHATNGGHQLFNRPAFGKSPALCFFSRPVHLRPAPLTTAVGRPSPKANESPKCFFIAAESQLPAANLPATPLIPPAALVLPDAIDAQATTRAVGLQPPKRG